MSGFPQLACLIPIETPVMSVSNKAHNCHKRCTFDKIHAYVHMGAQTHSHTDTV
jgi:hypothetical protein